MKSSGLWSMLWLALTLLVQMSFANPCANSMMIDIWTDKQTLNKLKWDKELMDHMKPVCLGYLADANHFESMKYALNFIKPDKIESYIVHAEASFEHVQD
jgi:hypothetical protein